MPAPAWGLIGRFIRSLTLGAAAGAEPAATIGPGSDALPPYPDRAGMLTAADPDTGAEIDEIDIEGVPPVPPDTDGAAIPMPAAKIAVKPAITVLFCMVAVVFMSVDTRTGSCDVPWNMPARPPRPSAP